MDRSARIAYLLAILGVTEDAALTIMAAAVAQYNVVGVVLRGRARDSLAGAKQAAAGGWARLPAERARLPGRVGKSLGRAGKGVQGLTAGKGKEMGKGRSRTWRGQALITPMSRPYPRVNVKHLMGADWWSLSGRKIVGGVEHEDMQSCRRWSALVGLVLLIVCAGEAEATGGRSLHLVGKGGSAFVVTASSGWRIDFAAARVSGGKHYSGVALELLGRPANDGLTALVTKMPTHLGGPSAEMKALGAVGVSLPRGHYLLVLLGDSDVQVTLPISGGSVSRPTPTAARAVGFREGILRTTFTRGMYTGHLGLALPPVTDPLVMTKYVEVDAATPQTNEEVSCVRRGPSHCPQSSSATFGTANQTTSGGGTTISDSFYDGFDGLGSGRSDLINSVDYRGTAQPASFYASVLTVSGRNR